MNFTLLSKFQLEYLFGGLGLWMLLVSEEVFTQAFLSLNFLHKTLHCQTSKATGIGFWMIMEELQFGVTCAAVLTAVWYLIGRINGLCNSWKVLLSEVWEVRKIMCQRSATSMPWWQSIDVFKWCMGNVELKVCMGGLLFHKEFSAAEKVQTLKMKFHLHRFYVVLDSYWLKERDTSRALIY